MSGPTEDPSQERVRDVVERYILARLRGEEADLDGLLVELQLESEVSEARRRIEVFESTRGLAAHTREERRAIYGDFAIEGELGRGGMGVVFRARQVSLDRPVALKILPQLAALQERRVERFLREAAVLGRLRHPGIVPVLTAGEDEGTLYFAMDLVPGAGLEKVLAKLADKPVAERTGADLARALEELSGVEGGDLESKSYTAAVADIAARLAEALAHAHAEGVVHRDVKPSNVILGAGGRPMLIDFGLATFEGQEALTRSGDLVGTPSYLPPERVRGLLGEAATESGDVYSLGAVLYEMLCGRRPFRANSVPALLRKIERGDRPRPRSLVPALPRDLETICLAAMEPDPARRYPGARALADDLARFLAFRPIRARPPSPPRRLWMAARRQPVLAIAMVAILLVAAGLSAAPWISAARDAREADRIEGELLTAVSKNRLDEADELLLRLVALEIDEDRRRGLEARILLRRSEAELVVVGGLRDGRGGIHEHLWGVERVIRDIEKRMGAEPVPETERQMLASSLDFRAAQRAELERIRIEIDQALQRAQILALRAGVERHPPVRRKAADCAADLYREAREAGDEHLMAVHRARLEELDDEGRHAALLANLGSLRVDGPADAEVFLYRYRPVSELRDDEWLDRLVPVPLDAEGAELRGPVAGALAPGETCLEVIRVYDWGSTSELGIRSGDLVFELDGEPCDARPWVWGVVPGSRAAALGARPYDRIAEVEGQPARRLAQVLDAEFGVHGPALTLTSPGGGCEIPREAGTPGVYTLLEDLPGLTALPLPRLLGEVAPPRELRLRLLRGAEVLERTLPADRLPGLGTRLTAAPLLFPSNASRGGFPLAVESIERGSYLLVARRDGEADLRLPLRVRSQVPVELELEPPPPGPEPPDAVWIPRGLLRRGDDPRAIFSAPWEERRVEGFWIARWELSIAAWADFAFEPVIGDYIEEHMDTHDGQLTLLPRTTDSRFLVCDLQAPRNASSAVRGLDYRDVQEYLDYLNEGLAGEGSPWIVDLPTDVEWERAASGADSRPYPWGTQWDPGLCEGYLAKTSVLAEPVQAYPTDESPFGVHGLAGGVSEWTRTPLDDRNPDSHLIYGSSRICSAADQFRNQGRMAVLEDEVREDVGLRLVFRPRPREDQR